MSQERIEYFTPPFLGHSLTGIEFANRFKDTFKIGVSVTGWNNIPFQTPNPDIPVTLFAKSELHTTDPALWTLERTELLIPDCITHLREVKPDLVISDFFSFEGSLAAEILGIPNWVSIPAFPGPYRNQDYIRRKLNERVNVDAIQRLWENHRIDFDSTRIEGMSDGFLLPGERNLVWSVIPFVDPNFKDNRAPLPYDIVGNLRAERPVKPKPKHKTPVVVLSFGTVVMGNVMNNQQETRENMKEYIREFARLTESQNVRIMFVTQGQKVLDRYPDNWTVRKTIDQIGVLSQADAFITHGGSGSAHEALLLRQTPFVVIPFFGDQHAVGKRIQDLHLGINLGGECQSIDTNQRFPLGSRLAQETDWAMHTVLLDHSYRQKLQEMQWMSVALRPLIRSQIYTRNPLSIVHREYPGLTKPLPLQRGEVLYGIQSARAIVDERQEDVGFMRLRPFSSAPGPIDGLPQLVDTYHDVRSPDLLQHELKSEKTRYAQLLSAYMTFLNGEKDICTMCVKGLDFFSQLFGVRFVIDGFDVNNNFITGREIGHIIQNPSAFSANVTFYTETEAGWDEVPIDQVENRLLEGDSGLTLNIRDEKDTGPLWEKGIFVASGSPVKKESVQSAIFGLAPYMNVDIHAIPLNFNEKEQQETIEETVFDATLRLLSLKKQLEDTHTPYGLIISERNGVENIHGKWTDVGIVMMMDAQGRTSIAKSEGIVFPEKYVSIARARGFDTTTIGNIIAEEARLNGYPQSDVAINPYPYLTGGQKDRVEIIRDTVIRGLEQLDMNWYFQYSDLLHDSPISGATLSTLKLGSIAKALGIEEAAGFDSESLINPQPVGKNEMIRGAENRIQTARKNGAKGLLFAIENGIEKRTITDEKGTREVWVDYAIVIVDDGCGHTAMEETAKCIFPTDAVNEMFVIGPDKITVGEVLAKKYPGVNKQDPHRFLTGSKYGREDFLIPAIVKAFNSLVKSLQN